MKVPSLIFCLFVSSLYLQGSMAWLQVVIGIMKVLEFAFDAIKFIKAAYDHFHTSGALELCSASVETNEAIYQKISRNLPSVMGNIQEIKDLFLEKSTQLERVLIYESKKTQINIQLRQFNEHIEAIRKVFVGLMQKLPTEPGQRYDINEIYYYTHYYIVDNLLAADVDTLRSQIFSTVIRQPDIIQSLVNFFQGEQNLSRDCGLGQSPQEYLYSIYHEILTVEIEAFVFHAFSYYFLYRYNNTVPKGEISSAFQWHYLKPSMCSAVLPLLSSSFIEMRFLHNLEFSVLPVNYPFTLKPDDQIVNHTKDFHEHIRAFTTRFTQAMEKSSRIIRPCNRGAMTDKKLEHPLIELEGAIQSSVNITSKDYVADYATKPVLLPRYCQGKEIRCESKPDGLTVCLNPVGKRRYEWFTEEENPVRGCNSRYLSHLDPKHFDINVCTCNGNTPMEHTTHIINLQAVEADVSKNMVVTGMRFVVVRGVLHIQIQQGEINENLQVQNVEWKPVEDISRTIYNSRRLDGYEPFKSSKPKLVEDVDFMIIRTDETDKINIGEVHVDENYVLTGLKFELDEDKHLQIAVIQTKFNYTTGQLMKYCGKMVKSPAHIKRKELFVLKSVIMPDYKSLAPQYVHGKYIQLAVSDAKEDSGQTTIPFFDPTEVVAIPPTPLGGAGLLFKIARKFAGIISPILLSLQYSAYAKASVNDVDKMTQQHLDELKDLIEKYPELAPPASAA